MSVNVKLGNATVSGINMLKVKDSNNNDVILLPMTKMLPGKVIIYFDFSQDFTGDGNKKIKWRPIVETTSGSWNAGTGGTFDNHNYTEIGEWKTYELTNVGEDQVTDTIELQLNPDDFPDTPNGYSGFGILIDLSASNYYSLSMTFYPHYGAAFVQDTKKPLNGYSVSMSNTSYDQVCYDYWTTWKNSANTIGLKHQSGSLGSSTRKSLVSNYSMIMFISCIGAED